MENTTQTETSTDIASETLRQINASDFWARARWGVQTPLADGRTLRLNCTKRIRIMITLAADDTYTIEIGRLKGRFDYSVKGTVEGVYADALVRTVDAAFSAAFGNL